MGNRAFKEVIRFQAAIATLIPGMASDFYP
jgi:hypothetical protein